MNFENNIEDLFKSKLGGFEAPVNDVMWSNISSSLGSTSASTTTINLLSRKLLSTAGVAITTGLFCIIGTFLVMNPSKQSNPSKEDSVAAPVEIFDETNQQITSDDELALSNILKNTPVDSNDPLVSTAKAETYLVVSSNSAKIKSSTKAPSSIINSFLTPKSRLNRVQATTQAPKLEKETPEENEITIIQPQEDELIATIIASPVGGYAPLDVYFSNSATHGSVRWNFGDGTSSEDFNPSHTFNKYGNYTVELIVTDENGEEKKDFRVIEVEANSAITVLPNIFTPNGDGVNDFCTVKGKNLDTFQIQVFDRDGHVIFESQSLENSWGGKNKFGENIPTGTYFYLISARGIDGKIYDHAGPITLNR
jgi:gliding motility-associated-like protein